MILVAGCASTADSAAAPDWEAAREKDTRGAYQEFARRHPSSKQAIEAHKALEGFAWQDATKADTAKAYKAYIATYPAWPHAKDAGARLDAIAWKTAQRQGTVAGFQRYLKQHPNGAHVQQAHTRLGAAAWQAARRKGTAESYRAYLKTHKKGAHAAEARAQIDRLEYEAASKKGSIGALWDYLRSSEAGRLQGKYTTEAQRQMDGLLNKDMRVPDATIKEVIAELGKLARPFSLGELHQTCMQAPPKQDPKAAFSMSGSSKGSGGDVSTTLRLGKDYVLINKARRQPGASPVMTTVLQTLQGSWVNVRHVEGIVTFMDLYQGLKKRKKKVRRVFALGSPTKSRSDGLGFGDIEFHAPDGATTRRYLRIRKHWYRAD